MKKYLYSLLFVSFILVSCVETPTSRLEKQATETFNISFNKLGEDYKNAKIEKIKTVFSSDNLCILHIETSDAPIQKLEYLFLSQDGKDYEAFQDLGEDSIYVSESTLKKISKGTIYENVDYSDAILFRASVYLNYWGNEVGNNNTDFFIHSPIRTGLWELHDYHDEFGDKTNGQFLGLYGKGTWSNSNNTDEKLIALLLVDEDRACLRLIKNRRLVDRFSGSIKIKDGSGEVHELTFVCNSSGDIEPFGNAGKKEFRNIIEREGILSAIAKTGGFLSEKYTYKFKFDLSGYKKAMKYICSDKGSDNNQNDEVESSDKDESTYDEELEVVNEDFNSSNESRPANESINTNENEGISGFTEPPYFEGGDIYEWLSNNVHYPEAAKEQGIQGSVKVSFIVEKDGSTSNIVVTKSPGKELNSEAIRLVKMTKWRPAKLNDKIVRSRYSFIINFRLQ